MTDRRLTEAMGMDADELAQLRAQVDRLAHSRHDLLELVRQLRDHANGCATTAHALGDSQGRRNALDDLALIERGLAKLGIEL